MLFINQFVVFIVALISMQNCFSMEPSQEENWWGIKCRVLPRSFGHLVDHETILINLPDGITGSDELIVKANVVHLSTLPEFVDDVVNFKGIEIWAAEYYINGVTYKPHKKVDPFDYSILGSPIFIMDDQSRSIHQALINDCKKLKDQRSKICISDQENLVKNSSLNFNPDDGFVFKLKECLESVLEGFINKSFKKPSISYKFLNTERSLWELPKSVCFPSLGKEYSFEFISLQCFFKAVDQRNIYYENCNTKRHLKQKFKGLVGRFNDFYETLIPESSHEYHTFPYAETWTASMGPSYTLSGKKRAYLCIAKNPYHSENQLEFLVRLMQSPFEKGDKVNEFPDRFKKDIEKIKIMDVPALNVGAFIADSTHSWTSFGITFGNSSHFVDARYKNTYGSAHCVNPGDMLFRLDFFTRPLQNDKKGIVIEHK